MCLLPMMSRLCRIWRGITVEPALFLFSCVWGFSVLPSSSLYIEKVSEKKCGLFSREELLACVYAGMLSNYLHWSAHCPIWPSFANK